MLYPGHGNCKYNSKTKKRNMYEFNREKITKARVRKHLSQRELAELVGVTHVTIYRWENGDRIPKSNHLADLANALGKSIEYFYDITKEE